MSDAAHPAPRPSGDGGDEPEAPALPADSDGVVTNPPSLAVLGPS